jgi:hypothetical protein
MQYIDIHAIYTYTYSTYIYIKIHAYTCNTYIYMQYMRTHTIHTSGSSPHLDISGYRWISLDINGYSWIGKDISWISLGKIGYLSDISKKKYPLEISKRYPDISRDIQATYP